ncbi:hypothetical protein GKJPGBOP_03423 [Streptomyces paromomycinus]|uniref:Uncharacterized protein n=1 Tax=Streptomyces paromomycinus TaxID=92743 RepID=A0A401W366_STREY|nr:hypothetical protein GKJPGBOP_03423 [Streptomyces paromomycinus]
MGHPCPQVGSLGADLHFALVRLTVFTALVTERHHLDVEARVLKTILLAYEESIIFWLTDYGE